MDVKWWLLRAVMMRQLCQLAGSAGGGLIASDMCCSWVEAIASDQWMNDNQMSIEVLLWDSREEVNYHQDSPGCLPGEHVRAPAVHPLRQLHCGAWGQGCQAHPVCWWHPMNIGCWSQSQASHDTLPTSQMKKWWMWCKKLHLSHPLPHRYKNSVIDFLIASGWISMSY